MLDLDLFSLLGVFILLLIPVAISAFFKMGLAGSLLIAVFRMVAQLTAIAFFLKYLFLWDLPWLNVLWVTIMVIVAVFSAIKHIGLKFKVIFFPIVVSFFISTSVVVLYLNIWVLKLPNIFDARYLVILAGMVLGNSLRSNIVGISYFYDGLHREYKKYLYVLSLGASKWEALLPFFRESFTLAFKPSLSAMATMGIVALPGMMTGVILAGVSPDVAIKYQIMIMIGIIVSTSMSLILTILLTVNACFTDSGSLQPSIFLDKKINF